MSEHRLQQSCVEWFRLQHKLTDAILASIPNEGRRKSGEGDKLRKLGLTAGMPDLILLAKGKVLFIEMKFGKGTLSPAQKAMHEKLWDCGHDVIVIRDFYTFMNTVNEFLE